MGYIDGNHMDADVDLNVDLEVGDVFSIHIRRGRTGSPR